MRVSVEIDGRRYLIEIENDPDIPTQIIVDGRKVPINVSPGWEQQFVKSLIVNNQSHKVEFEYENGDVPKSVWINGAPADIKIDFPGKGKIRGGKVASMMGGGKDRLVAPIPGKIVEVRVKEGDNVKDGEVLVVLEAMKMENELCASREAVIKQVLCAVGDSVELDQVLIDLA